MVVKLAVGDGIEEVEVPTKCPRCGKQVAIHGEGDRMEGLSFRCMGGCGELYYDKWLGIWRVKPDQEDM